jgi:retron-type reverse transcriptase
MKRYGNLWPHIIAFENLYLAARKAQKGKRYQENVLAFHYHLETELQRLQTELQTQTYQPGSYHTFEIHDPKRRLISAAPYRDRVVHHALCNIIEPILDRTLIGDTYANRVGYGTHRALKRFTQFCRSNPYILQCDIHKYFPSIDHGILKTMIRRKIKCPETLWLIDLIIDHSNPQEPVNFHFPGDDLLTPVTRRKGLPIGNLTSQFFGNLYLSGFDHSVKEKLKVKHYLRYVDDFACFSHDLGFLQGIRPAIEDYLTGLRLLLHPVKNQLFPTAIGANFVGFRILPDRIRVRNDNLQRARHRFRQLQGGFSEGNISLEQLIHSLQGWESHLKHGDTYRLRRQIFNNLVFTTASDIY